MAVRLTPSQIKKLSTLCSEFRREEVVNVALVLLGVRPGFWPVFDGPDDRFALSVKTLFSKEIVLLPTHVGPIIARPRSVSKSDAKILADRSIKDAAHMKASAKTFGYTGTAFPCSEHRGRLLIGWVADMDDDSTLRLVQHCAKPSELQACFDKFKKVREKSKSLFGVSLGGAKVVGIHMSVVPFDWI